MEYGVYEGCLLCPLYPLLYKQIVSQQFEAVVLAIDIGKRFSSELL